MKPPPLKDDCFAMPPGVDWTPVDDALSRLRDGLHTVVPFETIELQSASGRVLARAPVAQRANPPRANAAVDGYGFAYAALPGSDIMELPLVPDRAAAGDANAPDVPPGHAIRILTGAALPKGVDTVVLEEDCSISEDRIAFRSGIKPGANTRRAGEDVGEGDALLSEGRRLHAPDLALLTATGVKDVAVYRPLRVGVLSSGNEVVPPDATAQPHQIYDANGPMLRDILLRWGMEPVDLGHIRDTAQEAEEALLKGAATCDAILTSGGASASEEDHSAAAMGRIATVSSWRVALKPGRPIAMAMLEGVPVFGLPGNPVAAFVCTLIFASPALHLLAGMGWAVPLGFDVPAGFSKSKKPGRREYLRARLVDGRAEVFGSEGSGRISGLSWADGLVELPDEACEITPGSTVRYLPFIGFGI